MSNPLGDLLKPLLSEGLGLAEQDKPQILAAAAAANVTLSTALVGLLESVLPQSMKFLASFLASKAQPQLVAALGSEEDALFNVLDAQARAFVAKL